MRDLIFVFCVLGFFVAAVVFVRACELVVESGSTLEEQRQR